MPAPFGVTPTGFSRPSVQELIRLMEDDQRALIDPNIDTSSDGVLGQNNGIYARQLGVAWEALESVYNANDPDGAEDFVLTMLAKLTGTVRRGATKSRVLCNVNLAAGTTLIAGTHMAHVSGEPDNLWTPVEDFEAPTTGTHGVIFESVQTGPLEAAQDTIKVIATPVDGWNSVTNPNDAVPGRPADDDATLRQRRQDELTRGGSATIRAIRAELLGQLGEDGLESVLMLENFGNTEDGNGLPSKSFETIIWDDGVVADNDIAQVIFDEKPAGIRPFGSDSGTAEDENGDTHTVRFTRADEVDIYLTYNAVARQNAVGATAFKTSIVERMSELGPGDDVTHYDALVATEGLGYQITALTLGLESSPSADDDIPISVRQIARFHVDRIVLNVS